MPFSAGRLTPDPLGENYYDISPYAYCAGDPVNLVDPDGKDLGTPETVWFAIKHPRIATRIGKVERRSNNISTIAVRFSTRGNILYGSIPKKQQELGSEAGAMRQVLWQAIITAEFGNAIATEVGDAHETNPNRIDLDNNEYSTIEEVDTAIDLKNNQIGRNIGSKMGGMSVSEIALQVLSYYHDNGFYTVSTSNGAFYSEIKKLDDVKYERLKQIFEKLDDNGYYPDGS